MSNSKLSVKTFYRLAPAFIIILGTISTPLNCVRAIDELYLAQISNADISIFETQAPKYSQLQKVIIDQNKQEAALLISKRSHRRALTELLNTRFANKRGGIDTSLQLTVNPPSSREIQEIAKKQNATLVQYSIIPDNFIIEGKRQIKESELYIWVIKPTGEVSFRKVDLKPLWQKGNTSLADLVSSTREAMGVRSRGVKRLFEVQGTKASTNPTEKLQKLHQLLIVPITDVLPTNTNEKVIFIPQGALFLVPFVALQDESGKYLIEKYAISTAPSIQVLNLLHKQKQNILNSVLIVGNPDGAIPPKPGEPPQCLSSLPGAEEEAKAVASILNAEALTDKQATKAAVLERMPKARIIHLATCMFIDDVQDSEIPGAIALAPSGNDNGLLTAAEISDLKLNAELVVLSAGNTAGGRITADGVIGLSRAFMGAGVKSAIATLWEIEDKPPVLLMTEFYRSWQKNPDKSQALRSAMLTMMKKYPNPRDWAAFTLIGES